MKYALALLAGLALVAAIQAAPVGDDESNNVELAQEVYIADTIRALKVKLQQKLAKLRELSNVVKAKGKEAKEEIKKAMAELKDEVLRIHKNLVEQLKGIFNKKDTYSLDDEYIMKTLLAAMKERISALKVRIAEIKQELKAILGEQKEKAKVKLAELRKELKGAFEDLKQTLREIFGKDTTTETPTSEPDTEPEDETYMVDTVKALRVKLLKKLAQLKETAKMVKIAGAAAKEEIKKALVALKNEARQLRDEIREHFRDLFGKKKTEGSDVYGMSDLLNALKEKIAEQKVKLAELTKQWRASLGEKKEKLKATLAEVRVELREAYEDLKHTLKHIFGKETYSLVFENDADFTEFVDSLQ